MSEKAPKLVSSQELPVAGTEKKPDLKVVDKVVRESAVQPVDDPHDEWPADKITKPQNKPKEDTEGWREHFGPLAGVQEEKEASEKKEKDLKEWKEWFGGLTGEESAPSGVQEKVSAKEAQNTAPGTSLTEPVVIDELTRRVHQERKNEAVNRAQQGLEKDLMGEVSKINKGEAHIAEAEGLLGELARRSNQEALKKQVDEDLKTAAGPAFPAPPLHEAPQEKKIFTPTPEQLRGIESIKAAAVAQEATNRQKAEKLGVWGTIKNLKEKFDDKSLRAKVAISEGLRSLVPSKNRNRVLAVLGAAAIAGILFALYRRSGTFAEVDTGSFPPVQGFGDDPSLVGNAPVIPVETGALHSIPVTPEVMPNDTSMLGIFDGSALVEKGDTVWGLIKEKLSDNPMFTSLNEVQQAYVVDEYKDFLQSFDQGALHRIGIDSGDIKLIQPGQSIDLNDLNNLSLSDIIYKAQNLTPKQVASIQYNLDHGIIR